MDNILKANNHWSSLQMNTFSRWITSELKCFNPHQQIDITKDLTDGTILVELAESLTHNKAYEWNKKPKIDAEKVENCDKAIEMFLNDGVHIKGISGKDINDNNQTIIPNLIWTLILYYSIGKTNIPNSNDKKENNNLIVNNYDQQEKYSISQHKTFLLKWAKKRIEKYQNIHNFEPYELSICALIDSYYPDKVHYEKLDPENHQKNAEFITDIMIELGIPVFVFSDDLEKIDYVVDDKTLLTQLSFIKAALNEVIVKDGLDISDSKSENNSEKENESDLDVNQYEIVSEPESVNNDETSEDEPIKKHENDETIGFKIDYQDNTKGNNKKRIRVNIRNGDESDGFQVVEHGGINRFIKKYLHLSNVNQDGEPITNKNVIIRVKYHGRVIEKKIKAPFHEIKFHLHHHHQDDEKRNNDKSSSSDSDDNEVDLEKIAELEDEIEADVEKEFEAENDEEELVKDANKIDINNNRSHKFDGCKFALVMTLKESEYYKIKMNEQVDLNKDRNIDLALTLVHADEHFLNSKGLKLDLTDSDYTNNQFQQFSFGQGDYNAFISSDIKPGMVWDVANSDNSDILGAPFYLFPFNGKNNQKFVYENEMIYSTLNGQVLTYIGRSAPLVMMPPSEKLRPRQTFIVKLL